MEKSFPIENLLSQRAKQGAGFSTVTPQPPGLITFGAGVPDPASLPLRDLSKSALTVLASYGADALRYGGAIGDRELRGVVSRLQSDMQGITVAPEQVILTNGSSQALDLICETFLDPGDVVLTEDPSFSLSLGTIRAHGGEIVGVPVDDQGLDVEAVAIEMQRLQAEGRKVKFVYTIPDFQNPTGTTLTTGRRQALASLAREHGVLLVEDLAYRELRIDGEETPTLRSLAKGAVVQMGTFSKTIAPGLRLGWILADDEALAANMASLRRDMGSSPFVSRIVAEFIQSNSYRPHVEATRLVYRRKRDALHDALTEYCGDSLSWLKPEGGFFIWALLKGHADSRDLIEIAREEGVSFFPGFYFHVEDKPSPALRLSYSALTVSQIQEGARRLANAIKKLEADVPEIAAAAKSEE